MPTTTPTVSSDPLLDSVRAFESEERRLQVAKLGAVLGWAAAHTTDDEASVECSI